MIVKGNVTEGLFKIFEIFKILEKQLEPCLNGFTQFKKLIAEIKELNYVLFLFKIAQHMNEITEEIKKVVAAIEAKDFKIVGLGIGKILFMLLLEDKAVPKDNFVNFIKGFLLGLNEKGDITELLKCVKDLEHIIKKIEEAIKLLKDIKKIDKFIQGLVILFQAVTELINMLKPCAKGFEQIKKLFEALKHIDFMKLVFKIMANPTVFIQDIMGMIDGFSHNNLTKAGFCLGDFMYRLFLEDRQNKPVFSDEEQLNFLIELLDGFLEGIHEEKKVTDLLTCLGNSEDIIKMIKEAIEMIVKGEVTEGLFKLFEIFQLLEKQLEPCLEGFTQFKKLIAEIKELNYVLILLKIAQHMNEISEEIQKIVAAIEAKDFKVVGLGLGKILFMILLEDKAMPSDSVVNFIKGFLLGLNEKGVLQNY